MEKLDYVPLMLDSDYPLTIYEECSPELRE